MRAAALATVALLLALAIAGCTRKDEPAVSTPDVVGDPEAQALLARAARELPDVFSVTMNATTAGGQRIGFNGTFDNESGETFLDIRGDPRLMESLASVAGAGSYLTHGLSIYVTPAAATYVANGSAFVYVEDPEKETFGSLLPNPASSPLGALMRGDEIIRGYASEDIRVTNVTDTTWDGEPAKEMVARSVRPESRFSVAKLTVLPGEPPRIVHVRATMNGTGPRDPLANATLEGRLLYETDERIAPNEQVQRAIGMAFLANRTATDPGNVTYRFVSSRGVELHEVQVQVKVPNATAGIDPGNLATAWIMPLDALTRTEGNLTITFTDKDHDGKISANDTLRASVTSGSLPPFVLYDLVSALRVVPAGGWPLALLALVLVPLALRRRSF